ncbi:MAG: ABC transporter permease [Phycisphaerae bacterium]|jgi:phospholipid/cholesterol/gamma-HCH transport system permease protein|nr:ABC transporter permease [Phycisphaerae bacterium]
MAGCERPGRGFFQEGGTSLALNASSSLSLLAWIGDFALDRLSYFGDFWRFSWHTLAHIPAGLTRRRDLSRLLPQAYQIGAASVPVILVTGLFVGMVLAVQAFEQFQAVGLEDRMGVIVSLSVVRELGPVLAGIMLLGRVGGALTAELGTMNVTEQIDALRAMGADPIHVLVTPRFLACVLLTPVLTLYCNVLGIYGGWLISVPIFGVSDSAYWGFTEASVEAWDIWSGLIKSFFFGATLGMISCYKGFHCGPGAHGVGRACNQSFVTGFVVILIQDFFLALFLKNFYEVVWGFKTIF